MVILIPFFLAELVLEGIDYVLTNIERYGLNSNSPIEINYLICYAPWVFL